MYLWKSAAIPFACWNQFYTSQLQVRTLEACRTKMSTSDYWQQMLTSLSSSSARAMGVPQIRAHRSEGNVKFWMLIDFLTALLAGMIAATCERYAEPLAGSLNPSHAMLFDGRQTWILLGLLCGFALTLVANSRRRHLYAPNRVGSVLHEQRLTVEVCFTSGLLLTGTLYLLPAEGIRRRFVVVMLLVVTVALCVRRLIQRSIMHRRFEKGQNTRKVLIVGTGPEANVLRQHLDSVRSLGFTFKGFIESPGSCSRSTVSSGDIVGSFDTLFQHAREQFVDEIFVTMPCERRRVLDTLQKARTYGIDLRVVPDLYEGLAWDNPIEFVGQFPTIPLHRGCAHELGFAFKRVIDVLFSGLVLLFLSPFFCAIALAILIESRGPVFYKSQRIGKKGCVFRCYKFRTMVHDAERHRSEFMHMNERDGVLFKISNDPRITGLGRILRKYSLDELPQFINVLKGDMSVVGPRPPIASEVMEYELSHLRRLDVTPGITGLWQVQARQDPSFDSYVSLDLAYIKNWSAWLDLKIIVRTIGVVASGTGT